MNNKDVVALFGVGHCETEQICARSASDPKSSPNPSVHDLYNVQSFIGYNMKGHTSLNKLNLVSDVPCHHTRHFGTMM